MFNSIKQYQITYYEIDKDENRLSDDIVFSGTGWHAQQVIEQIMQGMTQEHGTDSDIQGIQVVNIEVVG